MNNSTYRPGLSLTVAPRPKVQFRSRIPRVALGRCLGFVNLPVHSCGEAAPTLILVNADSAEPIGRRWFRCPRQATGRRSRRPVLIASGYCSETCVCSTTAGESVLLGGHTMASVTGYSAVRQIPLGTARALLAVLSAQCRSFPFFHNSLKMDVFETCESPLRGRCSWSFGRVEHVLDDLRM